MFEFRKLTDKNCIIESAKVAENMWPALTPQCYALRLCTTDILLE
jgi:hypothetical protein